MRSVELRKTAEVQGFGAPIPLEVSEAELKTALNNAALSIALKTLPALAAYFAVVVFFREIHLLGPLDPRIHLATAATATILSLIVLAVYKRIIPDRGANLAIASAAAVAILHTFVQLSVTGQVDATIYMIVLLPAFASAVLSWSNLLSVLCTALGGWGMFAWFVMPASEWHLAKVLGTVLVGSALASLLVHRYRLNAYHSRLRDALLSKKQSQAFERIQCRYESAVRGANDGLWYWDLEADTLTVSARWLEMAGCDSDSFTVQPDFWFRKVDPYYLPTLKDAISSHVEGKTDQIEYKYRMRNPAGAPLWVLTRGIASRDSEGNAVSIAGSMTNIGHVIEVEQRLVQDALEDKLTGLANRHHLISHLEVIAGRSRNVYGEIALIFIDLDDFKLVNDSLGHPMGDRLLVDVATRLRRCKRPDDMLARYGGDEFVLLLENIRSPDEPDQICKRIQQALIRPFQLGGHELSLTTSMGVCIGRAGVDRHEDLLRNADIAMYAAKNAGRGLVRTYYVEMYGATLRSWAFQNEVKDVVSKKAFWLEYQPIVSSEGGRVVAVEALFRFDPRNEDSPSVEEFIRTAENIGLLPKLGAWILEEACRAATEWQQPGLPAIPVSVNVSAHQLVLADFPETVAQVLRKTGLSSNCLELEVTETALITNLESARASLVAVAATGVRISIDDFGTGYSSLHHLGNFPFATVKIDQSFVANLANDSQARALAVGIISLAHGMGMEVTAEGVESVQQLDYLTSLGCDKIQGYLVSRPLSETEFREKVTRSQSGCPVLLPALGLSIDRSNGKQARTLKQQLPVLQQALLSAQSRVPTASSTSRRRSVVAKKSGVA